MKKWIVLLVILFTFLMMTPVSAQNTVYKDVPPNYPSYGEIMFLLERGVVTPRQTFGTGKLVTREEAAVLLARAVGLKGDPRQTKFSDVASSRNSSGYVQSAVERDIISGYLDGTFRPEGLVTRGHMAKFLVQGFQLTNEQDITFSDVGQSTAAYPFIRKLIPSQITIGFPDGTFRPDENLTRAQVAIFLARALGYTKNQQPQEVKPTLLPKSIQLGQSQTQVVTLSPGRLVEQQSDTLIFADVPFLENFLTANYEFVNNQLVAVHFTKSVSKQTTKDELKSEFENVTSALTAVYGNPAYAELNWVKEGADEFLYADWYELQQEFIVFSVWNSTLPEFNVTINRPGFYE
ncbi:S-layer homology domain-containing protein [Chryseomicrobium palamuruense]|uniref:S-layer homology domain-containing protein n=1 Tax=Chryseomicrobium palamuruense TaxID=682973 RepID=A0ABV8UV41_9BACL